MSTALLLFLPPRKNSKNQEMDPALELIPLILSLTGGFSPRPVGRRFGSMIMRRAIAIAKTLHSASDASGRLAVVLSTAVSVIFKLVASWRWIILLLPLQTNESGLSANICTCTEADGARNSFRSGDDSYLTAAIMHQ